MSTLTELMQRHPDHAFATQYATASGDRNCVLSFHNYFDEIFPGKGITARLHAVFHDAEGREVASHACSVAPGDAMRIDAWSVGVRHDGIVAVAAIPDADPRSLAEGRLKIRAQIGTGFYITWDHQGRYRDTMHEWTDVARAPAEERVHHVGYAASAAPIDFGMILMNPNLASASGPMRAVLRRPDGRQLGAARDLASLPPMASRVVRMDECFEGFAAALAAEGSLVCDIRSGMSAPPLTAEWLASGDFHFHHI